MNIPITPDCITIVKAFLVPGLIAPFFFLFKLLLKILDKDNNFKKRVSQWNNDIFDGLSLLATFVMLMPHVIFYSTIAFTPIFVLILESAVASGLWFLISLKNKPPKKARKAK